MSANSRDTRAEAVNTDVPPYAVGNTIQITKSSGAFSMRIPVRVSAIERFGAGWIADVTYQGIPGVATFTATGELLTFGRSEQVESHDTNHAPRTPVSNPDPTFDMAPDEAAAYRRGLRDANLAHQRYVRSYLSLRRVMSRIAHDDVTNPAELARWILSTMPADRA